MKQLEGKIAIVTGSAHSIGKGIALAFAKEGANLALGDLDVPGMEVAASEMRALGVKVEAVPTDVTDEQQIEDLFAKTMSKYGRLDILVNNAGLFHSAPIDEMTTAGWDKLIATSLRGAFICTRTAFRIMKKQGVGRIINVGSISAIRVRENNAAYSAAKYGIVGLTHTTALEGRKHGITCGCLYPGNVRQDRMPADREDGMFSKEQMMTTEDIASAAVYMAAAPPHINVLELIQIPREQPFLARG